MKRWRRWAGSGRSTAPGSGRSSRKGSRRPGWCATMRRPMRAWSRPRPIGKSRRGPARRADDPGMKELDESRLDPAVALAALDDIGPREPHRQYALKQGDCFIVADAYGDIRG